MTITGNDLKKRRSFETFFQKEFTRQYPWGEVEDCQLKLNFPIDRVSHITHSQQASEIIGGKELNFLAQPKKGRVFEQVNHSLVYNCTNEEGQLVYNPVSKDEDLICPGRFSWWGIPVDKALLPQVDDYSLPSEAFTDKSIYGGVGFSVELNDLIQAYESARSASHTYFKVAGTLRYKREICYVVIICTDKDIQFSTFQDFILPEATIKQPYTKHMFQWSSWDHYALAFYFPDKQYLTLDPNKVELFQVNHEDHRCLYTFQRKECPDKQMGKIPFADLKEKLKATKEATKNQPREKTSA